MTIKDYQWAFSTVSKATLQASSTYQIVNFAVQADQTSPILAWMEPQRKGTERPHYARYSVNASEGQMADGPWELVWCIAVMTPLQFNYIDTNQFSSGAVENAAATIQTWDDYLNDFSCYQVTANRPKPGQDYDLLDGFYLDVKYRFSAGTKL